MNLKLKRFFVLIVKFIFCATFAHAQTVHDSSNVNKIQFVRLASRPKQPLTFSTLAGNFYTSQLPFFCNKELKIQKSVGFPVKFRLSTVEYCDKLEGKHN